LPQNFYWEEDYPVEQPPPVPPQYLEMVMYSIMQILDSATPDGNYIWCGKDIILGPEQTITEIDPETGEETERKRRENVAKGILLAGQSAMAYKEQMKSYMSINILPSHGVQGQGVGGSIVGPATTVVQGILLPNTNHISFQGE